MQNKKDKYLLDILKTFNLPKLENKFFIKCEVDKRVELISVVQTLNSYWDEHSIMFFGKPLGKLDYRNYMKEYFTPYTEHDAVKIYSTICNDVLAFSAFTEMILYYSQPPELEEIYKFDFKILHYFADKNLFDNFISSLREFYINTKFESFWKNVKPMINNMQKDFMLTPYLDILVYLIEDYLHLHNDEYNLIIAPQVLGNYGFKLVSSSNTATTNLVMSPVSKINNSYFYNSVFGLIENVWHEIGHSFINELSEKYLLFYLKNEKDRKISSKFKEKGYNDFITVINEAIIRALTVRLFAKVFNSEFSDDLKKYYINLGYTNIECLLEIFIEFENNSSHSIPFDLFFRVNASKIYECFHEL